MTDKKQNPKEAHTRNTINRREMIKKGALAAGGALGVAAFLDGKWVKPVVKSGVLPVHAQATVFSCNEFIDIIEFFDDISNIHFRLVPKEGVNPSEDPIHFEILGNPSLTNYSGNVSWVATGEASKPGGPDVFGVYQGKLADVTDWDPAQERVYLTISLRFRFDTGISCIQNYTNIEVVIPI